MLKACRRLYSSKTVLGGSYDAVVIGGGHNGLVAVSSSFCCTQNPTTSQNDMAYSDYEHVDFSLHIYISVITFSLHICHNVKILRD